jgi:hypothetical protein
MSHTPGPWTFHEHAHFWLDGADGSTIFHLDDYGNTCPHKDDANARLIAAAPELLDVCRCAVSLAKRLKEYVGTPPDYTRPTQKFLDCDQDCWDKADQLLAAAEAAIAKAEGR